jgi:hypothetical protein
VFLHKLSTEFIQPFTGQQLNEVANLILESLKIKNKDHDKGKDQSGLNWIKFDNNHYSNKNRIRY